MDFVADVHGGNQEDEDEIKHLEVGAGETGVMIF